MAQIARAKEEPITSSKRALGQRALQVSIDTMLGGFLFWTPSLIAHILRGYLFSGLDVIVLTALLPTVCGFGVVWAWKTRGRFNNRFRRAALPVLGIWLLGPLMMLVSSSFAEGGFSKPGGWHLLGMGTLLFPFFTFMMSTYDGTLGAVLLATLCLPVLGVLHSRPQGEEKRQSSETHSGRHVPAGVGDSTGSCGLPCS